MESLDFAEQLRAELNERERASVQVVAHELEQWGLAGDQALYQTLKLLSRSPRKLREPPRDSE